LRERNPLEIIEQRQTDSFEHWLRIGQSPLALCRDHPEAEYVETKARFLAMTAGAGEWATIHRELGDLNGLSLDEIMRRGPALHRVFAKLDQKQDEIFGEPSWKKQPQPSRSTSM
jgi:hypothetical protein